MRRQWKSYLRVLSLVLVAVFALTPNSRVKADDDHHVTFTTIDFPGSIATFGEGISSTGDIVGAYTDAAGRTHGFLLRGSQFTTIDFPDSIKTNAVAINSAGDVAGRYTSADGVNHGFLLRDGQFTNIDFPGATRTRVTGISPNGDIIGDHCEAIPVKPGCLFPSFGNVHGFALSIRTPAIFSFWFLFSEGTFTSIDFPGSVYTEAWRSNAAGQVVGRYKDADGHSHVYLRSKDGDFMSIDFPGAIETAFGNFSDTGGINARGDVASNYCDAAPCPMVATEINGNVHGFILRAKAGEFVSFDFPGALATAAYGINDHCDVVGNYIDALGKIHGFLRTSGEFDDE